LNYQQQKKIMVEYLQLKVFQEDWHGVADAAMDIRELEAAHKIKIEQESVKHNV
jgi:hypothetical protein